MGRYLDGKCKLCRREGMKLFLKGPRCNTEKCSFVKRPNPPGASVRARKKPSYYALQLREKQKVKRMYGMLESQFRKFFQTASKFKGITGRLLLQLLERRIDNVVYRSLFALSRSQARQFVRHGLFSIKGRRINIPSYIVKEGDAIEVRQNDAIKKVIKENLDINAKERSVPSWLQVDKGNLAIKVVRLPEKEDITIPVSEQLIVELYSK